MRSFFSSNYKKLTTVARSSSKQLTNYLIIISSLRLLDSPGLRRTIYIQYPLEYTQQHKKVLLRESRLQLLFSTRRVPAYSIYPLQKRSSERLLHGYQPAPSISCINGLPRDTCPQDLRLRQGSFLFLTIVTRRAGFVYYLTTLPPSND